MEHTPLIGRSFISQRNATPNVSLRYRPAELGKCPVLVNERWLQMAKAVSYSPLQHLEAAPSAWMQLEAQRRILRALHCSSCATRRQCSERVQTPIVSRRRLSPRRNCHRTDIRRPLIGNFCIAGAASASRLQSISSAPTPAQRPQPANSEGSVLDHIVLQTIGGTCKRAGWARQDLALRVSRLLALCRMSSRCSKHGSGRDGRRALRAVVCRWTSECLWSVVCDQPVGGVQ